MPARINLGRLPNGEYGLRISKPGYDVLSTGVENLLIDSSAGLSRVLARGTLIIPAGGIQTVSASIPSIGGSAPMTIFRYLEQDAGQTFAFPLWTAANNGYSAYAGNGYVQITRNYDKSTPTYIAYFCLAQSGVA